MTYVKSFKRFRMEIDLRRWQYKEPKLPEGYFLEPWSPTLLDAHATAHYLSFRNEIDSELFANFQTYAGSRRVVDYVVHHHGFLPEATWLAVYHPRGSFHPLYVGTMQGIIDSFGQGAIQNVGVVPGHRHLGLGRILISQCLRGYQLSGVGIVHLDVTAGNDSAIHLYQTIGFRTTQVFYREPKRASR